MEGYSEFALSDEEKARGLILACRAVPWEDSEVAWLEEDDLIVHPRRLLDCEVVGLDDATHDIKRIRLEIVSGGPFDFSAGQFASVTFEGCPPRDYSMANVPGDPILEFHVRRTAGGATSIHVSEKLKVGDHVRVEGPFGPSYLRESHRGPIIAVAGGSGMAPIKSVVERALQKALPQHIYFYFGVRTERDLYLHDHFAALAETHKQPAFHSGAERGRRRRACATGLVHEAVAAGLRRVRRLQGLPRRPAGHGRGGDEAVRAARHAAHRYPCRRVLHRGRDGQCGQEDGSGTMTGLLGRTCRDRHRRRPRHRPRHRRIAGRRGRERDRGRQRRLDRRRRWRSRRWRARRPRRWARRRSPSADSVASPGAAKASGRTGRQAIRRHRHRGEQCRHPARRLRVPRRSARLGRGDPQQPLGRPSI